MSAPASSTRPSSGSSRAPKYQLLRKTLLEQIGSGSLRAGERVPSESELIAKFRVSNTTVRRCLNDLAREGYIHRHRGRGSFVSELADSAMLQTGVVGILCSSLAAAAATPSFLAQIAGLEKYAAEGGWNVDLLTTRGLEQVAHPERALVQLVQRRGLRGLYVISPIPPSWLSELLARSFPVVSINIDFPEESGLRPESPPRLIADAEVAVLQAGEHLLSLGHRRIAAMLGQSEAGLKLGIPGAASRAAVGLRELVARHPELELIPPVYYDYFRKERARQQLQELLRLSPARSGGMEANRPTGLIVFEEWLGRAAWESANAAGLDVPGDLSIVCTAGRGPVPEHSSLTVCGCNYENLCWRAGRIMEQLLVGERPARTREMVSGELFHGRSSGRCTVNA